MRTEGLCFLSNKPPHEQILVLAIGLFYFNFFSYHHYKGKGAFPGASSILHLLLLACYPESS